MGLDSIIVIAKTANVLPNYVTNIFIVYGLIRVKNKPVLAFPPTDME